MSLLQEELAEIENLNRLAEAYGWTRESQQYKARLKLIQKEGLKKLKGAEPLAGGAGGAANLPKVTKWVVIKTYEQSEVGTLEMAKAKLKVDIATGTWIVDKACARSKGDKGSKAYRFLCRDAVGGPFRARLVQLTDGVWQMMQPQVGGEADDDDEDEEDLEPKPPEGLATVPEPVPVAQNPSTAGSGGGKSTKPTKPKKVAEPAAEEPKKVAEPAAKRTRPR